MESKNNDIAKRIKSLKSEIEKLKLEEASPKELAKYLVEVDKLTALMVAVHKMEE